MSHPIEQGFSFNTIAVVNGFLLSCVLFKFLFIYIIWFYEKMKFTDTILVVLEDVSWSIFHEWWMIFRFCFCMQSGKHTDKIFLLNLRNLQQTYFLFCKIWWNTKYKKWPTSTSNQHWDSCFKVRKITNSAYGVTNLITVQLQPFPLLPWHFTGNQDIMFNISLKYLH